MNIIQRLRDEAKHWDAVRECGETKQLLREAADVIEHLNSKMAFNEAIKELDRG